MGVHRPDDIWLEPSPPSEWQGRPALRVLGFVAVIVTVLAANPLTWLLIAVLIPR